MPIHRKRPFEPVGGTETPQAVALNRRKWLRRAGLAAGLGAAGYVGWRWYRGSDAQVLRAGEVDEAQLKGVASFFPAKTDRRFQYGRAQTARIEAARYTNFYEFSIFKSCWRHVGPFQPYPWRIEVKGLVRNELTLDIDQLYVRFAQHLVERQYRHRCVEKWAMAVPWTGIPLARVLAAADPLAKATHVRFVSFERPQQAAQQSDTSYPWPYTEGLTIDEAMNDLTLLAVGMYGQPLLKQHGAPVRLVVPWKYGYKSIKSVQRIEVVEHEPTTFWTWLNPAAYPFESNVDPQVHNPWPQSTEWMLGTGEKFPTQKYNGYGEYVARLYQ